jgi:hypothetical protein
MSQIQAILHAQAKPKEKQSMLVEAIVSSEIPIGDLIAYFQVAQDTDQGACADALKHISAARPELLGPYINLLIGHINDRLPRVKWGVP